MASTEIGMTRGGAGGGENGMGWAGATGREGRGSRDDEAAEVNVGEAERWASLVGGGLVTLAGLRRADSTGLAAALLGGYFVYRGATGHCPIFASLEINTADPEAERGVAGLLGAGEVHLESVATIDAAPEELYGFWSNFENHTRFAKFVDSVEPRGESGAHWVYSGPLGVTIEWDTEVTEDRPGEYLAWRSIEGSNIDHSGSVRFRPATGGRGTEVRVKLDIVPPLGVAGAAVAKLLEGASEVQLRADLKKFKQLMEAGEIATTEGQPSGRGRD